MRRQPIKLASNRVVSLDSKDTGASIPEEKYRGRVGIKKDWTVEPAPPLEHTKEPLLLAPTSDLDIDPKQLTSERLLALRQQRLELWAKYSGFEVDHKRFDFQNRRYLIPIYSSKSFTIAWQKAAQMGATIFELLYLLHPLLYGCEGQFEDEFGNLHQYPIKAGFFFPTEDGVSKLSKDRLSPLIHSNAELLKLAGEGPARDFKEAIMLKQFGKSSLYLAHLGGSVSKDSTPMDIIAFDEVRLLNSEDIDQADERISASRVKKRLYVSTAGYPGLDIAARFDAGRQYYWHSKCLCGNHPSEWVELSSAFPDCIVERGREVFYRCPKCGARIKDPQNGCYVPHNPDADYDSFHIHQLASRFISAKEILHKWRTTTNIKEFHNAKLGRPYVDKENVPISLDVMEACVNPDLKWNLPEDREHTCMGVDQRSGELHIVIGKKDKATGKPRLVDLDIIQARSSRFLVRGEIVTPFYWLGHYMERYKVDVCLIDAMPSANEALDFAREFPGKVWVAMYTGIKDIVQWSDRPSGGRESVKTRKASDITKFRWHVNLDRYKSMDFSVRQWSEGRAMLPPIRALNKVYRQGNGRFEVGQLGMVFVDHLKALCKAKVSEKKETGEFRMGWINLGLDPHFAHAWNYCTFAMERNVHGFNFGFIQT